MTARHASAPSVTVVVPVYQGERFLKEALQSLFVQTCRSLEIIAVDDGSSDTTPEILADAASRESRLRVLTLPRNEGVLRARERGFAAAQGRFIGFMDADDLLHPEAVERLRSGLERGEADIAVCGIRNCSRDGRSADTKLRFRGYKVFEEAVLARFCSLEFGTGSLCNKLYRRETIERAFGARFTEVLTINEDYLVNLEAFRGARRVCVLPDVLYYYRQHDGSTCNRSDEAYYFARALRAYVVGLETFTKDDPGVALYIDTLYRNLLRFDVYRVNDVRSLEEFSSHIAETLRRLAAVHPSAVYELCHLFDSRHPSLATGHDRRAAGFKRILDMLRRRTAKRG